MIFVSAFLNLILTAAFIVLAWVVFRGLLRD